MLNDLKIKRIEKGLTQVVQEKDFNGYVKVLGVNIELVHNIISIVASVRGYEKLVGDTTISLTCENKSLNYIKGYFSAMLDRPID